MTKMGSAFLMRSDRLLAIAFVLMVTIALAGLTAGQTSASFTGTSTNPTNTAVTMTVQPPAGQNAPTSSAAGVVNLSWSATPTAPGAGHTLTYNVLRGPVGGPYAQIGSSSGLTYSDAAPADGSYGYVIQAQVAGGGTFVSGNSAAQTGLSDRTAPTKSITCNAVACSAGWYNAAVSVTVSGTDAGSGMGSVTRNIDAGGQVSTGGSSATFTVSGDNAGHTVQYFTTDAAGNASASAAQTIKIDGTPPPAAALTATRAGPLQGDVTLTWTQAADATSGVATFDVYAINIAGSATPCPASGYALKASGLAAGTTTTVVNVGNNAWACLYLITKDNATNQTQSNVAKQQGK